MKQLSINIIPFDTPCNGEGCGFCPPCYAENQQSYRGGLAIREEREEGHRLRSELRSIFRVLRAEAQVLHMGLRPEPLPFGSVV